MDKEAIFPDILILCRSNVARSQIAEGFLEVILESPRVVSAGVRVLQDKWEFGKKPTPIIVEAMKQKGIDVSYKEITPFEYILLDDIKLIIVLCERRICPGILLDPEFKIPVLFQTVSDPREADLNGIVETRDEIETMLFHMLESHILDPFLPSEEIVQLS